MSTSQLATPLVLFALTLNALGCGGGEGTPASNEPGDGKANATDGDSEKLDLSYLSAEDQALALKQKFCPVGGPESLLGSGGMKAVKVSVNGRDIFLCCDGCEDSLREDPEKYFAILDGAKNSGTPSQSPAGKGDTEDGANQANEKSDAAKVAEEKEGDDAKN